MQICDAGGEEGVENDGAEATGGEGVIEGGDEGGEFGGIATVKDDVEAVLGEGVGEGFVDVVAGANDEGPGFVIVGAMKVARKGEGAKIEVEEARETKEE